MQTLNGIGSTLIWICRLAVGLGFAALIAVVSIQIATRTFGFPSPIWTEELSRYLLLYIVAFGVGLSFVTGEFVNVDLLQEAMSERVAWWMRLASAGVTALLSGVMIWPAWRFTVIGSMQSSPSLRVSMDFIHASVLALSILLCAFAVLRIIGMLAGTDSGRPTFSEDA